MMLHFAKPEVLRVSNIAPVAVMAFCGIDDFGNEFAVRLCSNLIPFALFEDDPIAARTFHLPLDVCATVQAFAEVGGYEAVH